MTTLQTIPHKKNELFEVEFYKNEECTEVFDFKNAKDLYIEPKNGDCTPIFALSNKLSELGIKARIFTPIWHLGWRDGISPATPIVTLNDVLDGEDSSNVNLSKYILEDNAVLFLNEEDMEKYHSLFPKNDYCDGIEALYVCPFCGEGQPTEWHVSQCYLKSLPDFRREKDKHDFCFDDYIEYPKKITIFLTHGTQSEIQKANEVAKELKEKYGVKKVNLFVLHCFTDVNDHPNVYALGIYDKREEYKIGIEKICEALRKAKSYNGIETEKQWCELNIELAQEREKMGYINKIITTNSTGILPVQDNERLQVIDGKEIFEEYLKTER